MKIGEKISIREILLWTKSEIISGDTDQNIRLISTDSRTIKKGQFFIPLIGENYDGHNFILQALRRGALGFVYESKYKDKLGECKDAAGQRIWDKLIIIQTKDNLLFFENISYNYIRKFKTISIGITGSVGKTTTKDFLVSILSKVFNIKFTPKNYNTEIGVSKSVLGIDRNTDIFIAELGMRGKGQIKILSEMINLDVGVITAIGPSHLEFFKSMDEIAGAKSEMQEILRLKKGVLFLNNDDSWTDFIEKKVECRVLKFGRNNDIDYNFIEKDVDNYGRFEFDLYRKKNKIIEIFLPVAGFHNIYNACAAAAVSLYLNVSSEIIKEGIENSKVEGSRMEIITKGDKVIINDCYNASPLSVRKAIDTLNLISEKNNKRSVAILGDMLELGKESCKLHYEIGNYLLEKNIKVLISFGKLSKNIRNGCQDDKGLNKINCICYCFNDMEELCGRLNSILIPEDVVLIKGSRANKMERIINFI